MKNLFLSLCLLASIPVWAQVQKGDVLLGGNAGIYFSNSQPNLNNQTNSNLNPFIQLGYAKNRMIGFSLDMAWQQTRNNENDNRMNQFTLRPTIQFTQLHPIKGNFGWLLQQAVGMGFYRNKANNGSQEITNSNTSVFGGITPGMYYAAGNRQQWLLTASVGNLFVSHNWNNQSDFKTTSIGTSLFQNFLFGFAYVLNKKEKK